MSSAGKRKLSAKQLVSDIRGGLDAPRLKTNYGLSDRAFSSVCRQLADAGAITDEELHHLTRAVTSSEPPDKDCNLTQWECPACHRTQSSPMSECLECGIVVAKYIARQHKVAEDSTINNEPEVPRLNPAENKWFYVVASIVALSLIGGGVVVWSMHRATQAARMASLDHLRSPSIEEVPQETVPVEETATEDQETSSVDSVTENDHPETSTITPGPTQVEEQAPSITPPPPPSLPSPLPVIPERKPVEPPPYVTGVLRQFRSSDFKKEVVEASKTFPVVFQFYSEG
jgi:hypothetical protein